MLKSHVTVPLDVSCLSIARREFQLQSLMCSCVLPLSECFRSTGLEIIDPTNFEHLADHCFPLLVFPSSC